MKVILNRILEHGITNFPVSTILHALPFFVARLLFKFYYMYVCKSFNESFLLSVCPPVCHHAILLPDSVSLCLLYFLLPVLPCIYLSVCLFICLSVCGLRCLSILVFEGVVNAFNKQSRSYNDLTHI